VGPLPTPWRRAGGRRGSPAARRKWLPRRCRREPRREANGPRSGPPAPVQHSVQHWGGGVGGHIYIEKTFDMASFKAVCSGEEDFSPELHPALRATPSPAARARARLLRAAARAYTALATTSVGPPVNHADPPHFPKSLGVRPPPPLLELRSWQYSLRSRIHKIKPLSLIHSSFSKAS
jgi:hypothetical protein